MISYSGLKSLTVCPVLEALTVTDLNSELYFYTDTYSFIEEIQRDMRIAFEKANHIIFMGYSLPTDDISYRSMLASRCQHKDEQLKVSVVLYDKEAKSDWYEGEELEQYIENYPNTEGGSSLKRIKEVLGDDIKLRAYLGGVPSVFIDTNGEVSKEKVLDLIYWN